MNILIEQKGYYIREASKEDISDIDTLVLNFRPKANLHDLRNDLNAIQDPTRKDTYWVVAIHKSEQLIGAGMIKLRAAKHHLEADLHWCTVADKFNVTKLVPRDLIIARIDWFSNLLGNTDGTIFADVHPFEYSALGFVAKNEPGLDGRASMALFVHSG